jgi:hypothetical protein
MTTGLIITKKQQRGRLTVKSDSLRREQRTLQRTCNAVKRQPTLNNFRERHARALAQAITDIIREYGYTQNIFLRLYLFYIDQFKTLEEIDVMKDIKKSLTTFVLNVYVRKNFLKRQVLSYFQDPLWSG